jgi:2-methylisocitrate lyase-like PEP mutase family enzyme
MTKTELFRSLHNNSKMPLILANIWDVGGARLVESLGAKAIATTSAGVGWSLGYADGNKLPVDKLAQLTDSIVRSVDVPVSVDVEAGYSDDPVTVGEHLKAILSAGVAGINIEDGTDQPLLLTKKIEVIKRTAEGLGVDVFVNARTDVYLQNLVPNEQKVTETLSRANIYRSAGADGLFVPGLATADEIKAITNGIDMPVNLLAWPDLPNASDLAKLGVRRLSAGSGIPQVIWEHIARLTRDFFAEGDSALFTHDYMAHSQLQGLFLQAR